MTDKISEAAKRLAEELLSSEMQPGDEDVFTIATTALARVLQEHSDVAKHVDGVLDCSGWQGSFCKERLQALILPDDPDPVEEAVGDALERQGLMGHHTRREVTEHLRAALAKHGLKIIKQD